MNKTVWKYYVSFYCKQIPDLLLSIASSVFQTLFILPVVYIVRYAFDDLIPNKQYSMLIYLTLTLLMFNIFSYGFNMWSRHLTLKTTKRVVTEIRYQLITKCFELTKQYRTQKNINKIHASIIQDTHRIDVMSNALISQLIPQLIIIALLCVVLIYLSPYLFLVMCLIAPFLYILRLFLQKKQTKNINNYHRSFEKYSNGISLLLNKMDLIKTQSAEEHEITHQKKLAKNVEKDGYSMAWVNAGYSLLQGLVAAQVAIIMLVAGGIAVSKQSMSLGELMSFYVAAFKMSSSLQTIFSSYPSIVEGTQSLKTLYNFININDSEIYKGETAIEIKGDLCLKSVCFSYDKVQVLHNTNLCVKSNSITVLLGANGIGKSTIVNLILGFYKPQKGSLSINNYNYDMLDITKLRSQISVVMQDPTFYPGSIIENICLGKEKFNLNEVYEACKNATALDFINKLPLKFNTKIGENGILLSGGQKQKIAIARAIFKKPKLLILDEPTNHLDKESIHLLLNNLKNLCSNTSILIITQDHTIHQYAEGLFTLHAKGIITKH